MAVLTAISLCSGYEGLGIGLKRAIPNLRTVLYVEREAFAAANLAAKIKAGLLDDAPVWSDLETLDARPFEGMVDIIHAGYPCQGESHAGKRKGKDDPRWVWPHIARIVQTVRPVWCFFENVPGHLTLGFPTVYRSLRDMGYSVEAELFTASECGAPHKRQRLFILAKSQRYYQKRGKPTCTEADGRRAHRQSGGPSGTSPELANSQRGKGGLHTRPRSQGQGEANAGGASELADGNDTGCEEQCGAEPIRPEHLSIECGGTKWPARPGQPQYEWEEPRTVVNASRGRCELPTKKVQTRGNTAQQTSERQTQSRLGRTTDGTPCRLDRIRLLGNGVVPQQAELAFKILIQKG